jgi:signal transduction histidine kinase
MAHHPIFTTRRTMPAIPAWRQAISGVRPRLLVWYFVLTAGTILISLHATRQIFYHTLQVRSQDALDQQIEQFRLMIEKNRLKGFQAATTLPILFDRLLSSYAQTRNEYVLTYISDRVYQTKPDLPPDFIAPATISTWKRNGKPQHGSLTLPDRQQFSYAVEPITLNGQMGYIIAIHNVSAEIHLIDHSLNHITQVVLIVLLCCLVLAWILIGRVLAPLKLLTKTAQSISESDMTQRITARGRDEIAELSITFNEMLDRLQHAFHSQKEFLKDASHELRTPITIIQGHLETLQYSAQPTEATIALLMDELARMSRLVNDLLTLAKADHPDFLQLRPEELDWLTEELYLKARSLADREWRLESQGLSPINVDRQRLTQAVMNLIQNAIRHTRSQDTITLGSAVKEPYAYFWVSDSGEGIAPADQARIFERFARATRPEIDPEGHGLGLAIVSAIIAAHNGWIELESSLGHGSTFTLVLPLNPLDAGHESNFDRRGQSPHQRLLGNRTPSPRDYGDDRGHRRRRETDRQ